MMTLTDIKNKILEKFNQLTIDDFYCDPSVSFAKEIFAEFTHHKSDDQIEKYLTDKFQEISVEAKRFALEKLIKETDKQIIIVQSNLGSLRNDINDIENSIEACQKNQLDISQRKIQINSEITESENEIQQIKSLAIKAPYNKEMEYLLAAKKNLNTELESHPALIEEIKNEILELQKKAKSLQESISNKECELNEIQTTLNKTKDELEQLSEKENSHYKDEYSSLEFLFIILLKKSIWKENVVEYIATGKKRPISYSNQSYDETEEVLTGEVTLETDDCNIEDYKEQVLPLTKNINIIPIGWRKILYKTLSKPLPNLAGTIRPITDTYYEYFNVEILELSNKDACAFLATKIAVSNNYSVKTSDNKIILGLSGGLSVTITFREKGAIIAEFQKQPFEIYSNCFLSDRFTAITLYHQTGYANSKINFETPGGYYILTNEFVIELDFNAAPILFDNNGIIKFAPNISSKAKHQDEISYHEAEERNRRQSNDDDWDDDY